MSSIPYFLIALAIAAILWYLGWRPYHARASHRFFEHGLQILLQVNGFTLLGVHCFARHKAKHGGGYEGGEMSVVLFDFILGIWRDPYRSRNSGEYMADKIYGE